MRTMTLWTALFALLCCGGVADGGSLSVLAPITPKGDGDPFITDDGQVRMKPLTAAQLSRQTITVAGVQMALAPGEDAAARVGDYIARAAHDKADLVVFPEYILGKMRVTDPAVERIRASARDHGVYVIVGLFEILDDAGRYGNCALLINRQGEIQGRYFKVHPAIGDVPYFWPPKADDVEWLMEAGDGFPVFDLDFGRVGILTCYDGYFPEPYRILALKGAEVVVWINARDGAVEDFLVKTAMMHNYVHMVCTNNAKGAGTMVAQWPASIVAGASDPGEQLVVSPLPMAHLRTVRAKGGREFRQRRPDLYGELLRNYPIWEMYSAMENAPEDAAEPNADTDLASREHVALTPVSEVFHQRHEAGLQPGQDLFRLGIRARAPWMSGGIELRFPEVLQSSLGMHVLDHFSPNHQPVSELDPLPQWRLEANGALSYTCTTPEGLEFAARATPASDEVALEFTVVNRSNQTTGYVEQNCCLNLGASPEFNNRDRLDKLYAVYEGRLQSLAGTTPTPETMGRSPWLLLLTRTGKDVFEGPAVSPTWWRVDQIAEENLMAAESQDGRHLVGYTWDVEGLHLMTNGGNPCLHAGPGRSPALEPGQSHTWRGKLYFGPDDPKALLARYHADKAAWRP